MIEQAIKKINEEMKNNQNGAVKRIGEFLISQVNQNSNAAEKILDADKTILKSLEHMQVIAKKQVPKDFKGKSYGITITDEEGFEIVLKYFGIKQAKLNVMNDIFETLDELTK